MKIPLTRYKLNKNIHKVKKYLFKNYRLKEKSPISKALNKTIRGKYHLKWENALKVLDNIHFIQEEISHWAETDGVSIWLSPYKDWTNHNLYYTLLHECLHGLVIRKNKEHELSEFTEHKFMLNLDERLIY